MRTFLTSLLLLTAVAFVLAGNGARAAETDTYLTVSGMHCGGCAKKIATKLMAVPGVEDVQADVQAKMIMVIASTDEEPSPRAMWAAVEKAGYKTVKLEGPAGSFTKKPNF